MRTPVPPAFRRIFTTRQPTPWIRGINAFPRLYHSVALLCRMPPCGWPAEIRLADVRAARRNLYSTVFIQPGWFSGDQAFDYDGKPERVGYGTAFSVTTPDAANIASVVLMKDARPRTHSIWSSALWD